MSPTDPVQIMARPVRARGGTIGTIEWAGRAGFFQEPFKATQCEPHFDQRDAIGANLSTIEGTNALIVVI